MNRLQLISLTTALLLLFTQSSTAQNIYGMPIDSFGLMIKENPDLFPTVLEKFKAGDTTLDFSDHVLLYYGKAFREDYNPYGESLTTTGLNELLEKGKLKEALQSIDAGLKDNPLNIRLILKKGNLLFEAGDTVGANEQYDRYYDLLAVPFYSGNGTSFDSAFVVTSVSDEYLILGELGVSSHMQSLVYDKGQPYDILHVRQEEGVDDVKYYFNISLPFGQLGNMFKDIDLNDGKSKDKVKDKKDRKKRRKKKKRKRRTD